MAIQDLASPRELGKILKEQGQEALVLVVFDTPSSKSYQPYRATLEALSAGNSSIKILALDVANQEALALARQLQMQSLPTTLIVKGGQTIDTIDGLLDQKGLADIIAPYLPPPPAAESLQQEYDQAVELGQYERALSILPILRQEKKEDRGLWLSNICLLWKASRYEDGLAVLKELESPKVASDKENIGLLLKEASCAETCERADWQAIREMLRSVTFTDGVEPLCEALLDFVARDRKYGDDLARKVLLGVLALQGDNDPACRKVRYRLANLLFI